MSLGNLFKKKKTEVFVSVDVGTSAIKLMELDLDAERPRLLNAAVGPTPGGAISNNMVSRPDLVGQAIRTLADANGFRASKAVFSIPGPAVFTKKVMLGAQSLEELEQNITFEAGNYIPHKIEAVHLDYQVLRRAGNASLEVLLVAVKNEIITSYVESVQAAGLEPAIADVDSFALENMFELNYPQELQKTAVLVNIGSRYSGVNILQDGRSLFIGDIGVGGRLFTDALCETLGFQAKEADDAKMGHIPEGKDNALVAETLQKATQHVASELHRQLGFFWNAAATNRAIDCIYLTGGASQSAGLADELAAKAGVPVRTVDPFQQIDAGEGFDRDYLNEIAPQMAVSVGLALRRTGDKQHEMEAVEAAA